MVSRKGAADLCNFKDLPEKFPNIQAEQNHELRRTSFNLRLASQMENPAVLAGATGVSEQPTGQASASTAHE